MNALSVPACHTFHHFAYDLNTMSNGLIPLVLGSTSLANNWALMAVCMWHGVPLALAKLYGLHILKKTFPS